MNLLLGVIELDTVTVRLLQGLHEESPLLARRVETLPSGVGTDGYPLLPDPPSGSVIPGGVLPPAYLPLTADTNQREDPCPKILLLYETRRLLLHTRRTRNAEHYRTACPPYTSPVPPPREILRPLT